MISFGTKTTHVPKTFFLKTKHFERSPKTPKRIKVAKSFLSIYTYLNFLRWELVTFRYQCVVFYVRRFSTVVRCDSDPGRPVRGRRLVTRRQLTRCRLGSSVWGGQGQTERRHLEKHAAAELPPTPPAPSHSAHHPSLSVQQPDKERGAGSGWQLDDDVTTSVS